MYMILYWCWIISQTWVLNIVSEYLHDAVHGLEQLGEVDGDEEDADLGDEVQLVVQSTDHLVGIHLDDLDQIGLFDVNFSQ